MSVINTNITSLIGQHNLSKSQSALQTSMERLSSGLRINSAKDDAAGQAIANRMTAQITGLNQAQRNANDGISVAQTAEGALNQVNDNLQRIRELSVQAQNDTNSPDDLKSIQDEIDQRLDEIDRISRETNFNGVKVLNEEQVLTIQVGANDNEIIKVNLKDINRETLGLSNLDVRNGIASDSLTAVGANLVEAQDAVAPTTVDLTLPTGSAETYTYFVGDDGDLYAKDSAGDDYAATYDPETNTVTVDVAAGAVTVTAATGAEGFIVDVDGKDTLINLSQLDDAQVDDGSTASYTFHVHTATGAYVVTDGTDTFDVDVDASGNVAITGPSSLDAIADAGDFGDATHTLTIPGQAAVAEVAVDLTSVNAELEGTNTLMRADDGSLFIRNESADGKVSWYSATADEDSGEITLGAAANNVDPLATLDAALNQVDSLRSELGAVQNRFEDAINNLRTNSTNLSAARSRIEDADYAVEVANMTRAQILQQAGTSVLAQANQIPQIALSLLG